MRRLPVEPEDAVRGVILPAGSSDVLLPNAAMAEILAYRELTPIPGAPPWLLGTLAWRGREVPVVSLAAAEETPAPIAPDRRARLAVCFTPDGHPELPYAALLCLAPPRLARFLADELTPSTEPPPGPFVLHTLSYAGRPAWIPDLDAIERALVDSLPS